MDELQSIYYHLSHPWKGQKAIKKLRELSKKKLKVFKQWLLRQAFWQVHSPPPKLVERPHYKVTIPNEMHQSKLLYVPSDILYGNKNNLGRVTMVISLVDEDEMSLKAFTTSCLKNDLKDFGLGGEWFLKPLGKQPSPRNLL